MPRTRPPYPPEFRQEAVRLLRSGARSTQQLAVELGCSPQTLSNWLRQDQADRGERQDVFLSEERQRCRRPPLCQDAPLDGRGRSPVLDRDLRRARAARRRLLRVRSRRRRNRGRRSRPAEHVAAFLAEPKKIESVYPDWDFWADTADRNRAFLPGEAR